MHPDPDDETTQHGHTVMRIPGWAASNPIGRAYARRRVIRTVDRELDRTGYTRTGPICIHIGGMDGEAVAVAHFAVRDGIAAAYANSEAGR